jgi:hypothetical protein
LGKYYLGEISSDQGVKTQRTTCANKRIDIIDTQFVYLSQIEFTMATLQINIIKINEFKIFCPFTKVFPASVSV